MSSNLTGSSCNSCTSSPFQNSSAIEGEIVTSGAYREFSSNLKSKLFSARIPTNGAIEIMENCNFRCIHCYQGKNKSKERLSGDQWCRIMDQLAEAGTLWLLITGGEPLLHPEFERIYKHAVSSGFLTILFTNGRLIQDRHIELLKEYPPFGVEITLYGQSEEMYRKVTGTVNSFEKVISNCRKLVEAGLPLKLKSVAFNPLIQDIPALKDFAEKELGVPFKFDTKLDPGIYGESYDDIRSTPEEIVELEASLAGAENIASDMIQLYEFQKNTVKKAQSNELLYRCGAGRNNYYIDYQGWVHTCSIGRLTDERLDLNRMSFREVWDRHLPEVVNQKARDQNAVCRTCEFREFCDVCPATAKLATGSKEGQPLYICQHTMYRKKRFLDSIQKPIETSQEARV